MRDITDPIDQMKGIVVVEFENGKRLNLSARAVERHGLRALVMEYAPEYQSGPPLPVFQRGKQIGTLSASWHPTDARRSLMYEPRPNDFRRVGDTWIADPMLGPGDLLHAGVNMIDKPDW